MKPSASPSVVLVNPRSTYVHEIPQKCYPPVHLLYLAAALKEEGLSSMVVDANALRLSDAAIFERLKGSRPHLVGFSVYSEILTQVRDLIILVKKALPQAKIVLGGPHASSVPETTLRQFPDAEFILSGEAERTLPLLLKAVKSNKNLSGIPGLFYRGKKGISKGPPPVFPEVDTLPVPAKELVGEAYRKKRYFTLLVRNRPVDTLFTSRGCPFSCGFCYNFRHRYRARAPLKVLDELVRIRESGIRDVEFCDDTFTVDQDRVMEIFRLIQQERLDVSFRIKSRVDVFTEKIAIEAKKAGVYLVSFGMESGSQAMLDAMNKGITLKQSARASELTRKHGMASHSSWVIGYPGETPDTVEETIRFILKNKPTTVNMAVLRPYPQTPAWHIARDTGALVGEWGPDSMDIPWVRLPWAEDKKVLDDVCKKAIKRIYFTPHYAASLGLRMVRGANWPLLAYALQESRKVLLKNR